MILRGFISNHRNAIILLLLALFLRLAYVFFFEQPPLMKDDLEYNLIAKNILEGKGFSYDSVNPTAARGPVYPLFLAASYFVFGYDYSTVRVLQAIIGAATCLFIFLIAKELYNTIVGFFASLMAAVYPSLIGYSGLLYSETLAAFLLSLSLLIFIISFRKKSGALFIITGALLGLLILCYPKFLFLPPLLIFSFFYYFKRRGKTCIKYLLGFLIGAFLVVGPWTLRNANTFKKFIPVATGAGPTLWYSTFPGDYTQWYFDREPVSSEFKKFFPGASPVNNEHIFFHSIKTNEPLMRKAVKNIKDNPLLFMKLTVKRAFRQWLASNSNSIYALKEANSFYFLNRDYGILLLKVFLMLSQVFVVLLACLGIFFDCLLSKNNISSPVFLSIAYSTFISSIFMTASRYQIPVLGLLFIYTALGSRRVFLMLSKRKMNLQGEL